MVLERIVYKMNSECFRICQLTKPLSPLHKIDASKCSSFQWKMLVEDLLLKAPTLLKILSPIIIANDQHKWAAVSGSHNPGLCMAVAILLKERNTECVGCNKSSLSYYTLHMWISRLVYMYMTLYFHGGVLHAVIYPNLRVYVYALYPRKMYNFRDHKHERKLL